MMTYCIVNHTCMLRVYPFVADYIRLELQLSAQLLFHCVNCLFEKNLPVKIPLSPGPLTINLPL